MRLIYHPEAEAERIEAARFYGRRVASLGAQFLDAADHSITAIFEAPYRWRIIEAGVRQCLMPCFPYSIYCRVLLDHMRVPAFKHHSRHPVCSRNRLSELAAENFAVIF